MAKMFRATYTDDDGVREVQYFADQGEGQDWLTKREKTRKGQPRPGCQTGRWTDKDVDWVKDWVKRKQSTNKLKKTTPKKKSSIKRRGV
jgi:hypothetical protein